eukprot:Nk52_evm13s274 gene=Nk52_evmTU13s274
MGIMCILRKLNVKTTSFERVGIGVTANASVKTDASGNLEISAEQNQNITLNAQYIHASNLLFPSHLHEDIILPLKEKVDILNKYSSKSPLILYLGTISSPTDDYSSLKSLLFDLKKKPILVDITVLVRAGVHEIDSLITVSNFVPQGHVVIKCETAGVGDCEFNVPNHIEGPEAGDEDDYVFDFTSTSRLSFENLDFKYSPGLAGEKQRLAALNEQTSIRFESCRFLNGFHYAFVLKHSYLRLIACIGENLSIGIDMKEQSKTYIKGGQYSAATNAGVNTFFVFVDEGGTFTDISDTGVGLFFGAAAAVRQCVFNNVPRTVHIDQYSSMRASSNSGTSDFCSGVAYQSGGGRVHGQC